MESGEWGDPQRTPREERSVHSRLPNGAARALRVLENTPQGRVGVKKSRASESETLRGQVASLAKEKRDLTLKAAEGERLLNGARRELQTALKTHSQTRMEMDDQRRVIHRLSADNARLIRQVESLWQQSPELKTPPSSSTPLISNHTHPNNILVKDLERLSQRATELSQSLSSTQQARTALERELLALKRSQLELQTSRSQLEEALAKSEEERAALYQRLAESEEGGRRHSEQMQLSMETALNDKTAKLEELLSLSERLQSALTSLSREKSSLESSLKDEATANQRLTAEKNGMKVQVAGLGATLEQTREELSRLQDHQLREVTEMKTILENEMMSLQRERDGLSREVEGGREERENMKREVQATRAELDRAENEIERLTEEMGRVGANLDEIERERAAELSEMTAREAELSARCQGLEREMEEKEIKSIELMEKLTNRLAGSGVHGNQLEAEAQQLRQLLEAKSHDLQTKSRDLDSAHSQLHASKMAQDKLQQQVSDLEAKVLALNDQISARTELTNEMRGLLEQRANQIAELEMIVSQQREELLSATSSHTHLSASHAHFLSGDSAHIPLATPIQSPYSSRPISPEPHPSTTPITNEVCRLRKQLVESRSRVLTLESSCEEIRTQSAKYQGSLQALTAIRERLSQENESLSEAKRRAEEGQRSSEEGRRRAEEGRRALSRQLSSLQGLVTGLRSQVAEFRGEKEEAMSQISELQEAFAEREAELAEELAAMEVQSMAASETGEMEREYLQLELAKSRAGNTELEQSLLTSQNVMEKERDELLGEAEKCSADLCTLKRGDAQVQEECQLAAAVNAKQTNQIAEKEGCVSELLGEVEVLRARKVVMMKWLCDTEDEKGLRLELESVCEELRNSREAHAAETLSLTQQLAAERERREEEERGRREEEGERRLAMSLVEGRNGPNSSGSRRVERMRSRLRSQVEQSNYLRVKLGYTLKELQLYKDLKNQLDSQLTQQASEISSLQEHYTHCLRQLQQVERLGFQATVSPSNSLVATDTSHVHL